MRERVIDWPSRAIIRPATAAKKFDPINLLAIMMTKGLMSVPSKAVAKRQPNAESAPNSCMPSHITHLPNGGWTT